jgi:hypothetical protein
MPVRPSISAVASASCSPSFPLTLSQSLYTLSFCRNSFLPTFLSFFYTLHQFRYLLLYLFSSAARNGMQIPSREGLFGFEQGVAWLLCGSNVSLYPASKSKFKFCFRPTLPLAVYYKSKHFSATNTLKSPDFCPLHDPTVRSYVRTRVYPKVSALAAWSEKCKRTALCH